MEATRQVCIWRLEEGEAAIELVGELCEWIKNHPDTLQATLNYRCSAVHCSVKCIVGPAPARRTASPGCSAC